jgi:hypothetical protein
VLASIVERARRTRQIPRNIFVVKKITDMLCRIYPLVLRAGAD